MDNYNSKKQYDCDLNRKSIFWNKRHRVNFAEVNWGVKLIGIYRGSSCQRSSLEICTDLSRPRRPLLPFYWHKINSHPYSGLMQQRRSSRCCLQVWLNRISLMGEIRLTSFFQGPISFSPLILFHVIGMLSTKVFKWTER